ncbi:MAG: DUF1573 domain-containing protein [Planctomycetes bacterium]|nr:DUF1573 domain-containing protein [Planctomycetota bacterium]
MKSWKLWCVSVSACAVVAALAVFSVAFGQAPEAARGKIGTASSASRPQPPGMAFAIPKRPEAGKEPKLVCPKKEHDFGTIEEGQNPSAQYPFRNDGPGDLILLTARPMCACAEYEVTVEGKPYVWGEPIAPKQSGMVTLTLHSAGFGGIDKLSGIELYTNDPALPRSDVAPFGLWSLRMHAKIERLYEFEGNALLSFGSICNLMPAEKSIVLKSTRGKPFKITKIEPEDDPHMTLSLEPSTDQSKWTITAKIPSGLPIQNLTKQFRVHLEPSAPPAQFFALASISGAVQCEPATLLAFQTMKKGEGGMRPLVVVSTHPTAPLKISNPRMLLPSDPKAQKGEPGAAPAEEKVLQNVVVTPKPSDDGKKCTLLVEVKPTMPPGVFNFRLAFDTGIPGGPETLAVPVSGYVR